MTAEPAPAPAPALAERVATLVATWGLDLEDRFAATPGSPGNFVAAARCADGTPCVLKVSPHVAETRQEIAAMAVWDGHGAARLLAAAPPLGGLLLERIWPGSMLAEVAAADDDAATRVAAAVLGSLWRPVPGQDGPPGAAQGSTGAGHAAGPGLAEGLRSLASWCGAFDRNRAALARGVAGFPIGLFERADALRADLLASTPRPVVLHGDLHHFNVLRSERAGWLAIDPKGLVGDPCFDVCQFLRNPDPVPPSVNRRRLDIFCAELGLDRRRTRDWCLVHAVLDACWSFEDGDDWQDRIAYAEQTLQF